MYNTKIYARVNSEGMCLFNLCKKGTKMTSGVSATLTLAVGAGVQFYTLLSGFNHFKPDTPQHLRHGDSIIIFISSSIHDFSPFQSAFQGRRDPRLSHKLKHYFTTSLSTYDHDDFQCVFNLTHVAEL